MLSLWGFARGSAIIHDFHSRSVMLPGTTVTSRSLALCLSVPCQLPHLVSSLHAYLKRLEKAVHRGEISAQSLSVIHSRASLFQSPALFGVFRLGATGSTFVSLSPHTLFSPICSFFLTFFKAFTAELLSCWNKQSCTRSHGPFVNVFTMMSRRLWTLNKRVRKETKKDAIWQSLSDFLLLLLHTDRDVLALTGYSLLIEIHTPLRICLKNQFLQSTMGHHFPALQLLKLMKMSGRTRMERTNIRRIYLTFF